LDSDDDTHIPDPTAPGNVFKGHGDLHDATNTDVDVGGLGTATTTGYDVDTGASLFVLLQYARNTTDSINKLKGLLASTNHDHKQDIATAYPSIQAMLNQLTPTILANTTAVVACNKTIDAIPNRVVNAILPKMAMTIHSARDDLSTTMASTMTSALSIFHAKMDEAILRLNEFGKASQTQTTSTIDDSLDRRLLPITAALSLLEAKVAALNVPNTTELPNTPTKSTTAPPPRDSLVIDTTTPSPQEASPSSAPTVSCLFPNIDPSKLFPQDNSGPYDHTYCASNGRENNCINASTPHGQQHAPGPDPNHPRVPVRSTLPINPYKPSRTSITDAHTTPGHIILPHHINRHCVATSTRISPHDIAGLANKNYHGGELGFYTIDCKIIHACGYTKINTADVIGSYNDIIIIHKHIVTNWEGRYTEGPQIDRILEKGLPTFPCLHSLMVEVAVDWYDKLQNSS
jgi:hypothetical protein